MDEDRIDVQLNNQMNQRLTYCAISWLTTIQFALCGTINFQNIGLDTKLDLHSMTNLVRQVEISEDDHTITFRQPGLSDELVDEGKMTLAGNMVFHQLDGNIEFRTNTNVAWLAYSPKIGRIVRGSPNLISRIQVNGKSIEEIMGNPIYGKKIAVIGDSEINGAYECDRTTTYPNYIVQRNNMTMFQTACSKLAMPRYTNYNPSDGITYLSLVGNYKDLIPKDVDIIWIHNGYNDKFDSDTADDALLSPEEANLTDQQIMATNIVDSSWTRSYKKSFNTLMIALTNEYRNAKIAVSLPYNWNGGKTSMNNFIKARCAVYGIEYIDGSAESGFTLDDTRYFTVKSDGTLKDAVHLSLFGSERISWTFENFMKTRMQISPRLVPQRIYDADDTNNLGNP